MTLTLRSWTAACSAGALLLALGTSGAAAASSEGVAPRAACAVPQASSDADALGEQLTQRFLRLLKKRDVPGLREFLAPNFQIMRSNGVADTKRSYLKKDLPVIESFTISRLHGLLSGSTLTVTMRGYGLEARDSQRVVLDGKGKFNYCAAKLTEKMVRLEQRMRNLARLTTQLQANGLTGVVKVEEPVRSSTVRRKARGVNPLDKLKKLV
jgi:hypothetical protein